MAGLIDDPCGSSPDRERGQIILLAAFSLAVAFVALSVIINGAIFTQNLATRGDTAGGGDALQYRQQIDRMAGDLLEHANDNYTDNPSTIRNEFEAALGDLSNASAAQQAVTGRAANYTVVTSTTGGRLSNGTGDFNATADTSTPSITAPDNWVVASDVDNVRRFNINVTEPDQLEPPGLGSDEFDINVIGTGGANLETELEYDTTTSEIIVRTFLPSGGSKTCTEPVGPTEPVSVNFTDGRLAGKPCEALDFGEGLNPPYDIEYFDSTKIEGKYSLTLNTSTSNIAPGASAPTPEEVVYSTHLRYTYRTANLAYETDVRVAPGEPDA